MDQQRTQDFFADLGDTTITLYPTYIKRMAMQAGKPTGVDADNSGYYGPATEALAAYLRDQSLAQVQSADQQVPLDTSWQRAQISIVKASTNAFSEYVAAHPIDTEYAMMAEYLIPFGAVWAVHAYVVDATGEPVWVLHLNEHFDEFSRVQPKSPQDATRVLLQYLQHGWPRPAEQRP